MITPQNLKNTQMPVLFLGHGSPMNAIESNSFSNAMNQLGQRLPQPKSILMISAHWMTKGTWVTHMQRPRTIHDFIGFPKELFEIQYPASGNPELAKEIRKLISDPEIGFDDSEWGLDHGAWSVLTHLYPKANIPVVQLSLDMTQPGEFHFELGKKLRPFRKNGVLIIGSGNIVHNLRQISWEHDAKPYGWAIEFDELVKSNILERNFKPLVSDYNKTEAGRLSVPTPEHYYPLLSVLGATQNDDELHFDIEGFQNASISMRSFRFE